VFTLRLALLAVVLVACNKKVTPGQCDALVGRYAELVVRAQFPDASASKIELEREREKSAAHGDDSFRNCTAEVEASSYECAMRATTPEALEHCLE
jgi:hypothetical protein